MQQTDVVQTIYCADVMHGGVAVLLCAVDEMVQLLAERTLREPGYKINLELDGYTFEDWIRNPTPVSAMLKEALHTQRAELVNGTYTQPMSELIGLESNIRQLQWGKRLANRLFDVDIDTYLIQEHAFHTALPQILLLMGYKQLVLRTRWPIWGQHLRYSHDCFFWQGADGSCIRAVPAYQFMHFGYVPHEIPGLDSWIERGGTAKRGEPLEESDIVGWLESANHEGIRKPLATRVPDIIFTKILTDETVQKINSDPRLQFVTVGEHARMVAPLADEIIQIPPDDMDTTLPFGLLGDVVLIGCKRVEQCLLAAEKLSTVAYLLTGRKVAFNSDMNIGGGQNFEDDLAFAWRKLMLAQQHDIWVCGPASVLGYSLADRGMQWLRIAEEITTEVIEESLVQFLVSVAWQPPVEGATPILVANHLSWSRSEVVRAEILCERGERRSLSILDTEGQPVATQVVEEERYDDDSIYRTIIAFLAEDVPGIGYRIYFAAESASAEKTGTEPSTDLDVSTDRVANAYLEVRLGAAGITAIRVRATDQADTWLEVVQSPAAYLTALEGDTGRYVDTREYSATVTLLESGPVFASYRIAGSSPIFDYAKTITVTRRSRRIEIEEIVDVSDYPYIGHHTGGEERTQAPGGGWHKAGWHTDCFIEKEKLRTVVPVNVSDKHEVTRNVVYVPSSTNRADFSAYDWADVSDGQQGVTMINFGNPRYHYDRDAKEISMVLGYSGLFIYSTSDEYHRMRGEYRYRYVLAPHGPHDSAWNNRQALEAQNPLMALRMNRWPVSRPPKEWSRLPHHASLFALDAPNASIATVFLEQGATLIRIYEHGGNEVQTTLSTFWDIAQAEVVDLTGKVQKVLEPLGKSLLLSLSPYQIVTIRIGFVSEMER